MRRRISRYARAHPFDWRDLCHRRTAGRWGLYHRESAIVLVKEFVMITVLLVDDHTLIRDGLRRLLQDNLDIQVVGEASDGHEALRLLRQLQPDVVVMDLSMPGLDGIEATKRALGEGVTTRILILTMHANEEYAVRVLQAGARGFIGKGAPSEDVVAAIRKVAAGSC